MGNYYKVFYIAISRIVYLIPLMCVIICARGAIAGVIQNKQILLEEIWRTDPEQEPYFRSLSHFIINNNQLYDLDRLSSTIYVYSIEGILTRTIRLEGEGPGEIYKPATMMLLSDRSIGLLSIMGPKLIFIDMDGYPSYEFGSSEIEFYKDTSDVANSYQAEFCDGRIVLAGEQAIKDRLFVSSYDLSGSFVMNYMEIDAGSTPGVLILDERDSYLLRDKPWCLGAGRRVYISEQRVGVDHYSIIVFEDEYKLFVIKHPFVSRKRTRAEIELLRTEPVGGKRGYAILTGMGGKVRVDDYAPDIKELFERDGILWVRTSISDLTENMRTYDLYDRRGNNHGSCDVVFSGINWKKDQVHFVNDYVIVVKGEYDANNPGVDPDPDPLQFIITREATP
jgi:hypothetical protein